MKQCSFGMTMWVLYCSIDFSLVLWGYGNLWSTYSDTDL